MKINHWQPRQGAIQIALEALGIDEPIDTVTITQTRATVGLENGDAASKWIQDDRRTMEAVNLDTDDGFDYFRVTSGGKEVTISRAKYDQWATVERLYGEMLDEMRQALRDAGHPVSRRGAGTPQ